MKALPPDEEVDPPGDDVLLDVEELPPVEAVPVVPPVEPPPLPEKPPVEVADVEVPLLPVELAEVEAPVEPLLPLALALPVDPPVEAAPVELASPLEAALVVPSAPVEPALAPGLVVPPVVVGAVPLQPRPRRRAAADEAPKTILRIVRVGVIAPLLIGL
ncbi:MAG: hypothetical protein ACYDCL_08115 [Myxococcales bacterium]